MQTLPLLLFYTSKCPNSFIRVSTSFDMSCCCFSPAWLDSGEERVIDGVCDTDGDGTGDMDGDTLPDGGLSVFTASFLPSSNSDSNNSRPKLFCRSLATLTSLKLEQNS